ncbi:MAG: hypothetical protein KatS3mg076_0905 [Candidatus Binatia bacterium]|nr:MAG: hypothetical protein KatS3mg076_0905 [Candidatus Binatia bacterium]
MLVPRILEARGPCKPAAAYLETLGASPIVYSLAVYLKYELRSPALRLFRSERRGLRGKHEAHGTLRATGVRSRSVTPVPG